GDGVSSQRGVSLDDILASFRYQRDGVETSPMYGHLLTVAIDDTEQNGLCAEVLARTPDGVDPVLDALPLRFLGGIHRLVLDGEVPELARFYPTAGGQFDPAGADGELAKVFL